MNISKNIGPRNESFAQQFITPLPVAIQALIERSKDLKLHKKINRYLENDIPEHFKQGPILYLSRHVATPNFATLRFVELGKEYGLPMIIGQDKKDVFVSHNSLKRSLGKLPIVKGTARNADEIIEYFTIIDFNRAQGERFMDIKTIFGVELIQYHTTLFQSLYPKGIRIVDESDWVDRHHRGCLLDHYKKILALLLVHGVMFEFYEQEDHQFVSTILEPAFSFVTEHFGYKPLICNLVDPKIEELRDWHSYPSVIYKKVHTDLQIDAEQKTEYH